MSQDLTKICKPVEAEMSQFIELYKASLSSSNVLLNQVIEHVIQKPGKMMRPLLLFLIAKYFGKVTPVAYHAAVSLELLHTATLIHDDVVDESDQRRGQTSVNAAFNNKVAVLSGDFFLATALQQVSLTRNFEIVDIVARLGQVLADGELLQLYNIANNTLSYDVYFDIIKNKTAILFSSCARAGAIAGGADSQLVKEATEFGEYIGLCFQIKDDILDYFESKDLGKPTGNDMKEGKLTLPVLYALNSTQDSTYLDIAKKVRFSTATDSEIHQLIEFAKTKGGIDFAYKKIDEIKEKASAFLADAPQSSIILSLQAYLDYVVERNH
ncbi:MAG: polyprenyl synthetase family protein [Bacteroidaceae bacterium]|nr:polyprenyl synthetase family protein [Bacteroidaceae bacterium]